jgi:hypothetical protein
MKVIVSVKVTREERREGFWFHEKTTMIGFDNQPIAAR